ncbi:MAG: response regulator [Patescibacteria group bacterium]
MEQLSEKRLVCIIDDNEDIRTIYKLKFEREGFPVATAANGEEGLRIVREQHPAVILLDIQMPVMDGLEALKILRSDEILKKIPVVILSNVDSDDMFQKVGDLGAAEYYLVKSLVDPQKVVDVTLEALSSIE